MANVVFKKGMLKDLPATLTAGTLYVTTDERAIYLDVDSSKRIRIGNFQEFDTVQALEQSTNKSTTALYYVKNINCLAKYDGEHFVQINLDTGATKVDFSGDGNAITSVTYDPSTRTLTFVKGETFAKEGTTGDTSTEITLYGVKKYAEEQAAAVLGDEDDDSDDDTVYGAKAAAAEALAAAEAAQDEAGQKISSVTAGDASVVVGGTDTDKTVKVQIDDTEGNDLTLVPGKGLRVEIPDAAEYTIMKQDQAEETYATTYYLAKNGQQAGVKINIPKDMVVQSGTVEEKSASGTWGDPGTYLHLVLANADSTDIYINVGALIEYVTGATAADGIITVTVDADTHVATATIGDATIPLTKLDNAAQTKIGTAYDKAVANEAAITAIKDGDELESFGDVEDALSDITTGADINDFGSVEDALDDKAPIESPALTGTPTAPTAEAGTNTDQLATTKFVQAAVNAGMAWGDF